MAFRAASRVATALLVVGLVGCAAVPVGSGGSQGTGPASSSPTAAAVADPTPSQSPLPSASAVAGEPTQTPFAGTPAFDFQNWGIGEVLVDGLRVRTQAGTDAPAVLVPGLDTERPWVLNQGDQALVTGGGAEADGYRWWEVFGVPDGYVHPWITFHGWVASGPADDPWIVPADDLDCPQAPAFAQLAAMPPYLRLACYGNAPITFTAYAWTVPEDAGLGGACMVEPEREAVRWLLCDHINYAYVNATGDAEWTFLLHFNPDVLVEPDWPAVEGRRFTITGHFDDPASTTCGAGFDHPAEGNAAYWTCAMLFVVDAMAPA